MRTQSIVAGGASLAALVTVLGGCVTVDPYPSYWPPLEPLAGSACPDVSGRYRAEAIYTRRCQQYSQAEYKADWHCEIALDWALRVPEIDRSATWIELRQPDPDRIVVVTPSRESVLLRSRGDFDCDDRGIEVSEHASAMAEKDQSTGADVYQATTMAIVATGGISSLTRHFRRASDGSLVAELQQSSNGLLLAIPYHLRDLRYLRWAVWTETSAADPQTSAP